MSLALQPLTFATAYAGSKFATFTTSSLAVGTHGITASYAGDEFVGANTAELDQLVNLDGTVVTLTTDTNAPDAGQPVNLTVQVDNTVDNGRPSGNVDIFDGA